MPPSVGGIVSGLMEACDMGYGSNLGEMIVNWVRRLLRSQMGKQVSLMNEEKVKALVVSEGNRKVWKPN